MNNCFLETLCLGDEGFSVKKRFYVVLNREGKFEGFWSGAPESLPRTYKLAQWGGCKRRKDVAA